MRPAQLLALATGLSIVLAAGVVAFVLQADFLTGAAEAAVRAMFAHGVVAAAAAASPVVAFLLVGYAYMQRGIRRRAARREAEARAGA